MTQPDANSDRPARRPLSRWKKLCYAVVTVVLFFVVVEGILALVGVRPLADTRDPFVGFAVHLPLFVPSQDQQGALVTAKNKLAWFNRQQFPRVKPPRTYRIFCLGGSTTYGRPYNDATSFAGWMRELLPLADPDTNWEVINAGGVSYASYRVAAVMKELAEYQPDLFVIYTGHNEFLEERTYRDIRDMPSLQRNLLTGFTQTRTYTLLHNLLADRAPQADEDERFILPGQVKEILEDSVGPTSYQRDDKLREQVLRHFQVNLQRMVRIARSHDANVLFVTPAGNRRDCSPFKSQHADGLSEENMRRCEALLEEGRRLAAENPAEALVRYREAEKIDGRYAEVHYRKGRALFALSKFQEAEAAFVRAIEEDVCPLRALRGIRDSVRKLAAEWDVPAVDFDQRLQDRARAEHGHGLPGRDSFFDHVHFKIDAHGWLARLVIEELTRSKLLNVKLTESHVAQAEARIQSRIDPKAHAVALLNLAKVLNWAGKHYEAGPLALEAADKLPSDPEALVLSAAFLEQTGRADQAMRDYRRALETPSYYDAQAHKGLGILLAGQRKFDEAKRHFMQLTRLEPKQAEAWHWVGKVLAEQRRFSEAVKFFQEAVRLKDDAADIHYNLAFALTNLGRRDPAIQHYREAIRLNPDDADAHHNLGVQLLDQGHKDEAAKQFREVLRIRPGDDLAKKLLREASP